LGPAIRRQCTLILSLVGAALSFVPFLLNVLLSILLGPRLRRRTTALIEGRERTPVDEPPAFPDRPPSVYILAGEDSGDHHAGNLVAALRDRYPDARLRGMGGPRMRAAGCELDFELARMNVMGVLPVIRSVGTFARLFRDLLVMLDEDPPDVLVPVDYPGFNLRVARAARKRGVRVVFWVAPQVWAWAPFRMRRIARAVDRLMLILPFERELFRRAGIPVAFVGHPLFESLQSETPRREDVGPRPPRTIGLLPGSRRSEIRGVLPTMLRTASLLLERFPDLCFRAACRDERDRAEIERILAEVSPDLTVTVTVGGTHEVMRDLDLALVASGTATLELAYYGVPMVVLYRVGRLASFMKRFLLLAPHVALVNLVAGRRLVPEYVDHRDHTEEAVGDLARFIEDPEALDTCRRGLVEVRERLLTPGVAERAARWVAG